MSRAARVRRARVVFLASVAAAIAALAVFGGAAASAPVQTTEVRVVTLPIANGFPLDIGIRKGFFSQQGIEIKKTTLQSGNDVVLAMANNNGDIGYLGFVPMFIAVTNNVQYDSQSAVLGWQSRFRWIITPGNDLYVVYTHNWQDDPLRDRFDTLDKRLASKVLYTYRF